MTILVYICTSVSDKQTPSECPVQWPATSELVAVALFLGLHLSIYLRYFLEFYFDFLDSSAPVLEGQLPLGLHGTPIFCHLASDELPDSIILFCHGWI